jgi:hypothetical protein
MRSMLRQREDGQALVLVALVLTFLMILILTCIEVGGRYLELAEIEDALKQATRSSVQTFDYAAFARGGQLLRETGATRVTGCAGMVPNSARFAACSVFLTNLRDMHGLAETNEQTAAHIQWTFLPQGGTCTFPNRRPSMSFTTPAVCATLTPHMTGLLGWGVWTPQIDAADTLDPID